MRLGIVAASMAAALMASSANAACDSPLSGPGTPVDVRAPADEADRRAMSAAVFLALSDDAGGSDWVWREMAAAPPCPVSSFKVDGVTWHVSGGEGAAPLRWARADGVDVYYALVRGPSPAEAQGWAETRRNGAATGASATYLVASEGDIQFVLRIYDGAPDARRLAGDLVDAIAGKLTPVAAFDPTGDAVTLSFGTPDGVSAELFRPALLGPQRHATLLGPDGRFFTPGEGGVRLRGSEHICGDAYGPFARSRLTVMVADDPGLDLGCSFYSEESWISVFATRRPDTDGDKARFRDDIRATQADTGVKGRPVSSKASRTDAIRASAVWIDKTQKGQGLWFIRQGEYVIEIRATFRLDETDAVYDLVAAMLKNEAPPPKPDLRG